jgi:hypothetical protein
MDPDFLKTEKLFNYRPHIVFRAACLGSQKFLTNNETFYRGKNKTSKIFD